MRILVTVFALIIFAAGIFLSQRDGPAEESSKELANQEVLSEDSHSEENNEVTIENEVTSSTQAPAVESPIPTKSQADSEILAYRYPGAQVVASTENSLTLKSSDSPEAVTNWYKDKIESEGMNTVSFVETEANEKILNELVGADGQRELRVEIKKDSEDAIVEISVSLNI